MWDPMGLSIAQFLIRYAPSVNKSVVSRYLSGTHVCRNGWFLEAVFKASADMALPAH